MTKVTNSASFSISDIENQLKSLQGLSPEKDAKKSATESGFSDLLKNGLKEVNAAMQSSDKAAVDLASGKNSNIHEAMLAATRAELGFNLMVQVRNKAIESYQEVMRMQV